MCWNGGCESKAERITVNILAEVQAECQPVPPPSRRLVLFSEVLILSPKKVNFDSHKSLQYPRKDLFYPDKDLFYRHKLTVSLLRLIWSLQRYTLSPSRSVLCCATQMEPGLGYKTKTKCKSFFRCTEFFDLPACANTVFGPRKAGHHWLPPPQVV